MEIERKIKTVEIEFFEVFGKKFMKREEAEEYLDSKVNTLRRKYYIVDTIPDLELGKGYYQKQIVSIPEQYDINFLYEYLLVNYGRPMTEVYSTTELMSNYIVSEEYNFICLTDLNSFLEEKRELIVGDKKTIEKLKVIHINGKDIF